MAESRRGLLFLCVANSARSQLAEGIARSIAPQGVEVFSAGSAPTRVHPGAIAALQHLGVDIGSAHAKGLDAVPLDRVGTVVTLCAEEYCPDLGPEVQRLHWVLDDPVGAGDDGRAFQATAEELHRRITDLFATPPLPGSATSSDR